MAKQPRYDMERLFMALSSDTRLKLLGLLGDSEVCVCHLVEALKEPQPKISQHLACLRSVGAVEARREGKWMHYHIVAPPHEGARSILKATLDWLKTENAAAQRKPRSGAVCCAAAGTVRQPRNRFSQIDK